MKLDNFPRIVYHKEKGEDGCVVRSQEEYDNLGVGWVESPGDFALSELKVESVFLRDKAELVQAIEAFSNSLEKAFEADPIEPIPKPLPEPVPQPVEPLVEPEAPVLKQVPIKNEEIPSAVSKWNPFRKKSKGAK